MPRPPKRLWALAGNLPLLLVLAAAGPSVVPPVSRPSAAVCQEPAAAAAFLAAYARGDEAGADRLASPLYRAEWARVGVSPDERVALRPWSRSDSTRPAVTLDFSYVDGVAAAGGFMRLLYAARATAAHRSPGLSVWRADTDPDGRVVWVEMVWLFSDDVAALVPVDPSADLPLPPELAALRPRVRTGVRSASGPEGYYVLGPAPEGSAPSACSPVPAVFLAIDADGDVRPGGWSYGQPPGLVEYGTSRPRAPIDLTPDLAALRGAYLGVLP